jgi:hypothetical protein
MLRAVLISGIILYTSVVFAEDFSYLPSPSGFVESSTLVPGLKDQALLIFSVRALSSDFVGRVERHLKVSGAMVEILGHAQPPA